MTEAVPDDRAVLEAALAASQELDMERFLEACLLGIGKLLDAGVVHAYVRDPASGELELRASWPERRKGGHRPAQRLSRERLAESRLAHDAGEAGDADDLVLILGDEAPPWAAFVASPREKSRGKSPEPRSANNDAAFETAAAASAAALARRLGPAARNVRLLAEVREEAVRDDLSRCYNRRHFDLFLKEEVARARRFRTHVSLVFFDLDNLKPINTERGHAAGSQVLVEVAERVSATIRGIDKLFRFGGDEFCLVLPQTNVEGAVRVAQRARMAISERPFLGAGAAGVGLTASLGVATFPEHGGGPEELIDVADRAMQEVKQSGKDDVGVAQPLASAASTKEER